MTTIFGYDLNGDVIPDGAGAYAWASTAHDGYAYDIPESAQGQWEIGDDLLPVFVPFEEVDVDALIADLNAAPLGRSQAEIDESQALEDEAATQAYLRQFGMGSWMSLQPVRFPLARVDAPVYA